MSLIEPLNPKKPNALHLLGKELVAWKTDEGEWVCMDDQCSHRLAPLSGPALPCCRTQRGRVLVIIVRRALSALSDAVKPALRSG